MSVFGAIDFDEHEQVTFFHDKASGLKAVIAIHNTNRGPALGGCRIWPYKNEQDAVTDVLRLSRGMTYKAAMANLPFGGGKAVIIADSHKDKTPDLLKAYGRCVNHLNGRYITAEDVGTSVEDMATINEVTEHVVGLPGKSGDPSPFTAIGVYESIRAAAIYRLQKPSLKDVTVAVQGLGHVGYHLSRLLVEDGAKLIVTDIDQVLVNRVAQELHATAVSPEEIYGVEADVFSPCALGAIINEHTISQLKCVIVTGSANNQLSSHEDGEILAKMNILYSPDYVVNAGGLIDVSYEKNTYDHDKVISHVRSIHHTLLDVFRKAEDMKISTSEAADLIAEERFKNVS